VTLDTALIRRRRRELGWSQREVGRRIGVSSATVARLEDGANHDELPLRQLVRLTDVLAVDPADLLARPAAAAPTDTELVQRVGALITAADGPATAAILATATGATGDEVDAALEQLDLVLQAAGLRLHRAGAVASPWSPPPRPPPQTISGGCFAVSRPHAA
jgi:transcriptional regulator with XRE-family HTH domain